MVLQERVEAMGGDLFERGPERDRFRGKFGKPAGPDTPERVVHIVRLDKTHNPRGSQNLAIRRWPERCRRHALFD